MHSDLIRSLSQPLVPIATGAAAVLPRLVGIRAVVFDIYGTLVVSGSGDIGATDAEQKEAAMESILRDLKIEPPAGSDPLSQRFVRHIKRHHQLSRSRGIQHPEVEIRDIWADLLERDRDELLETAAITYECATNPVWPMPGAQDLLAALRERGLLLGIVSNAQFYTPLMFEALLRTDLATLGFDAELCYFSYQFGEAKPGLALYTRLREALAGLGDGPLRFLVNTHHHGDHTGGNAIFGIDTPIIAHDNVRARLAEPDAPQSSLPVVTFDRTLSVHFNGERIEVLHFPKAHTDGDAVIFFHGSNVIHTGDIFFHRIFPFVDIDGGGSVAGVMAAAKTILQRTDAHTKIIPGHGPLATPDDLRTYLRMLEESLQIVEAGVQAGKALEELQAAGVGQEWSGYSWGFISTQRWVATLHRELTATP